ncbi:hypothetical protein BX616_005411 [Lobosporangium transversale]|uniref:C2H2-type domain-containing protein n=1 Tax=Lobosporangium transversale TaxID=64571 RepID=A0A1Y2GAE1_9FUNG|nr:hypothetical protein BCR41DRAFT_389566 [Lobosporangium transversale]KAF9919368.1 hypothetical protein BX616_005411 [Lobosporangium transversale]ORZ05535.1 hypothetical protein BCR41DRAFT_389566 [Lobosporangium transversale]|eukprot:XP_021877109.1 hypothetical protein BCR41DRAFT_389566 [Lobosporangium transversale]
MHVSNTFTFGAQGDQAAPGLRRETTMEISKMYTTLYDQEDPQLQQEFTLYQQQQDTQVLYETRLNPSNPIWTELQQQQLYASPASPASSCFSGPSSQSSSESAYSSPAAVSIRLLDADETGELVDQFNITIDELLSESALPFDYSTIGLDASDFDLFTPSQQQQSQDSVQYYQQLRQHQKNEQEQYYSLHSQRHQNTSPSPPMSTQGGPQRSRTLSPEICCDPYPSTFSSSSVSSPSLISSFSSFNSPAATFSSRYSHHPASPQSPKHRHKVEMPRSPCPSSPAATTPSTPYMRRASQGSSAFAAPSSQHQQQQQAPVTTTAIPTDLQLPNTEGMTVIRSEDGSIMVFNPVNESMTFRCELCPLESFGRIHDLKRHQASKHQEKTWPCEYCPRTFVRRDALLRHYTVKSHREDGIHPASHETEELMAARARSKLI